MTTKNTPLRVDRLLHCRWCGYTTLAVKRHRNGHWYSGWGNLRDHQEAEHLEEHEALMALTGGDTEDDDDDSPLG